MKNKLDTVFLALGFSRGVFSVEDAVACSPLWGSGDMSPGEALEKRGKIDRELREDFEAAAFELLDKHGGDEFACMASLDIDDVSAFRLHSLVEEAAEPPSWDEETLEGTITETGDTVVDLEDTRAPVVPPPNLRQSHPDRYLFLDELGRGGLGRVLDATDTDMGRSVAVKMMLPEGMTPARLERFLFEARTTARLTHPNIVPVYEIGVISDPQNRTPYFTMLKIVGRDLRRILADLRAGDEEAGHRFSLQRLLGIFLEACNAVSFAHDKGVLHRDLKPGNIMVGEYGEVFVVDWGLALVKGTEETQGDSALAAQDADPPGVMGSPAYMSPEQADGRSSELDERSDVYSLGAILYQILAKVPPFHGYTVYNVIDKVLHGDLEPPSARLVSVREQGEAPGSGKVPAELDEICLKAMARDKSDRFPSVGALGREIRKYLEGEKERTLNRAKAEAKINEGRALLESLRGINARLQGLEAALRRESSRTPAWLPVPEKAGLWKTQDELEEARDSGALTFTRAARAFQAALEFDRDSEEARAALADMYWERFLVEEEKDSRERIVFSELVREFGGARYDARIRGDGKLSISARAYRCPCLREPKEADPSTFSVLGYHPFSGSKLDHEGAGSTTRAGVFPIKAHGTSCSPEPVEGADVWVFALEGRSRMFAPVFPIEAAARGTAMIVPENVLDMCFEKGSPYRPELHSAAGHPAGAALYLGRTPFELSSFPMGSYLAIVHKEGFKAVRVPFRVARQSAERLDPILFRPEEIPDGFVQVGGGRFTAGGDRNNPYSGIRQILRTDLLFLARHPVTCADYLEYLNSGFEPDLSARAPRRSPSGGFYWPRGSDGRHLLPGDDWFAAAPEDSRSAGSRLELCDEWWNLDWPVFGVSSLDLLSFAAWRSRSEARVYSLPGAVAWEKAARGADGRAFPWGDRIDGSFANYKDSWESGLRPAPVGSFPCDESPCGVRGMAGNVRECCLDLLASRPDFRIWRGGAWPAAEVLVRVTGAGAFPLESVNNYSGGRLAWYPVLPFNADSL